MFSKQSLYDMAWDDAYSILTRNGYRMNNFSLDNQKTGSIIMEKWSTEEVLVIKTINNKIQSVED